MIRVALIGYGLGGEVFHAPLVHATGGMQLVSIVTSDPGRRARALERYPDADILDTPETVWARAGDHDLVVVTTPNRFHAPLASKALESGLAVVVDKPLAPSAAEGESLVAEAERRGLLLSVFHNRRWDGDFLTLRRLLDEGVLGRITRLESRFERWRPEITDGAWRERPDPQEGGGLLLDLGSHLVDQAMQLFGPPQSVYAEVQERRPGAAVDDDTFVALTHAGGERSHLWMSAVARLLGPRFRVLGLKGAYVKHGLDLQEEGLSAGTAPDSPGFGMEPPERWGVLALDREEPIETTPGRYLDYYEGVAAALTEGAASPVDPREAVAGLRVLEAAMASARSGEIVRLDEGAAK